MSTALLTRTVTFAAAHRYHRPDWSAKRNTDVFGSCANEHGHGHTYRCRVTVAGPVDADTGMLMDLAMLDQILHEEVIDRFDHRHINLDVPEFAYGKLIPTAEALAVYIWECLVPRVLRPVRLHGVRIDEDDDLYAEYFGDT